MNLDIYISLYMRNVTFLVLFKCFESLSDFVSNLGNLSRLLLTLAAMC